MRVSWFTFLDFAHSRQTPTAQQITCRVFLDVQISYFDVLGRYSNDPLRQLYKQPSVPSMQAEIARAATYIYGLLHS